MPATVRNSAVRSKPRRAPAPDLAHSLHVWRTLAESSFVTDANVIAKAAKDLLQMIEQFQDEHNSNSLTRELSRAGLQPISDRDATALAKNVLSDLAGIAWCLDSAVAFLTSELPESLSADRKEGARHG